MKDMQDQEKIIWQYLDGELDLANRALVESRIKSEPKFADLFRKIKNLESQLEEITPDKPSVRFVQNVLESIPGKKTVRSYTLIPPSFWKWGVTGISMITILSFLLASVSVQEATGFSGFLNKLQIHEIEHSLTYVYLISTASVILFGLDYFLKKKWFHS